MSGSEAEVGRWLRTAAAVTVLTGAGISTDSGIPDYRGPNGVWTHDPTLTAAFTYDVFLTDANLRARFWHTYLGHAAWKAAPNPAHRALARLQQAGIAVRVLTQNIDGLHQAAGTSPRKVFELHGTIREVVCIGCRSRSPSQPVLARVAAGDTDPRCVACGAILKLAVVLFGEHLDPDVLSHARQIAAHSGLMLVVGSSLQVEPVASLCTVAVNAGSSLVIVNRDPTPYDEIAVEVIREPIGTAIPRICALLTAGTTSTPATRP